MNMEHRTDIKFCVKIGKSANGFKLNVIGRWRKMWNSQNKKIDFLRLKIKYSTDD